MTGAFNSRKKKSVRGKRGVNVDLGHYDDSSEPIVGDDPSEYDEYTHVDMKHEDTADDVPSVSEDESAEDNDVTPLTSDSEEQSVEDEDIVTEDTVDEPQQPVDDEAAAETSEPDTEADATAELEPESAEADTDEQEEVTEHESSDSDATDDDNTVEPESEESSGEDASHVTIPPGDERPTGEFFSGILPPGDMNHGAAPIREKKPRRAPWIVLTGLVALVVGALLGAMFVPSPHKSVPAAAPFVNVQSNKSMDKVCQPFEDKGLTCHTKTTTSENQPGGVLIKQSQEAGDDATKGSDVTVTYSKGPETGTMPDVTKSSLTNAKAKVTKAGLTIGTVSKQDNTGKPKNQVVSTTVDAGDKVHNGDRVNMVVSSGKSTMPTLTGKTEMNAQKLAKKYGVDVKIKRTEGDAPYNHVMKQSVKPGKKIPDKKVELTVTKPNSDVSLVLPDLEGVNPDQAQTKLANAGFQNVNVVQVRDDSLDKPEVVSTSPDAGQYGVADSTVTLVVGSPQ